MAASRYKVDLRTTKTAAPPFTRSIHACTRKYMPFHGAGSRAIEARGRLTTWEASPVSVLPETQLNSQSSMCFIIYLEGHDRGATRTRPCSRCRRLWAA